MLGQRQLHQDAVDGRIGVQLGDLVEYDLLVDVLLIDDLLGVHADGQAAIDLVLHVDLRGRVFANQNDHQTGLVPFGRQGFHAGLEALPEFLRQCFAVNDLCRHRRIRQKKRGKAMAFPFELARILPELGGDFPGNGLRFALGGRIAT